ncbi:hypothetical protein SBA6_650009 [Candidatus Sulfopaludibacter sp. SbA6]|nr:hypothetical protein SBA6_650009 [Candidatus Sulfopaludibacter sp. SbA6]
MSWDLEIEYLFSGLVVAAIAICIMLWQRRRARRSVALAVRESPKSPIAALSFEEAMSLQRFTFEIRR